jgi:hypothetical protein
MPSGIPQSLQIGMALAAAYVGETSDSSEAWEGTASAVPLSLNKNVGFSP